MQSNNAPSQNQTTREHYFDVVDTLCKRFIGLSPFEVLNTDMSVVYDLFVDTGLHDYKDKNENNGNNKHKDVWVTSKNATWH